MKIIILSNGKECLVDDADYENLNKYKWHFNDNGYAVRSQHYQLDGINKNKTIKMHRAIMGYPEKMMVDHINRDKLDNRRENLRVCTRSQNLMNMNSHRGTTSKYKGVSASGRGRPWIAKICKDRKQKFIGHFDTERDAAIAYNKMAIEWFGPFANLNQV